MKKKIIFAGLIILIALTVSIIIFTGLIRKRRAKMNKTVSDKPIEKVVVRYSKDDINYSVSISLDTGKRTIKTFNNDREDINDNYEFSEDLTRFIKDRILANNESANKDNSSTSGNDDLQVLWSIKIRFSDKETVNLNSFEKYPEYWDEFIELINK